MAKWKEIGLNVIKLEGYGVYVTYVDSDIYISNIVPHSGKPALDPDKCIAWDKLEDPENQEFLNLIDERFKLSLKMTDFHKTMTVSEIRSFSKQQEEMENND